MVIVYPTFDVCPTWIETSNISLTCKIKDHVWWLGQMYAKQRIKDALE
jgi:hypothetical protein